MERQSRFLTILFFCAAFAACGVAPGTDLAVPDELMQDVAGSDLAGDAGRDAVLDVADSRDESGVPDVDDAGDLAEPGDVLDDGDIGDAGDVPPDVWSHTLEVLPASLNFATVAVGVPVGHLLTIVNHGSSDLVISAIEVIRDLPFYGAGFNVTFDPAFPATDQESPTASIIPAGKFQVVNVTYLYSGGATGADHAVLRIISNATGQESVDVPMTVQYCDMYCRPQVLPSTLNFGDVAPGESLSREVRIVNTGTTSCTLTGLKLADCTIGEDGEATCPEALQGDNSALYSFASTPSTGNGALGPGKALSFQVAFAAPESGAGQTYQALLTVRIREDVTDREMILPESGSGTFQPNVTATVVEPSIDE